ncbi:transglutaminaseTgpA domain-containing protein [Pseudocolwellia sp. HL-MZ7]|uniref:transglutaminase family protein n=1 Tax=Pseudocolwellia sp. HL-MZ7 TaxID=3400627 RepID=UPI003CF8AB1D
MLFKKRRKKANKKTAVFNKNFSLSKQNIFLLITCQFVNLLTLSFELSWWMLSIIAICLGWQLSIVKKLTQKPNKVLIAILSITGCILLALTSQALGLLSTMLHLLCLSYVLKSFELNKRSDFYQMILLGLFVLIASLIFQQSLYFAIIISLIIIFNFTLIIGYFAPSKKYSANLNMAAKVFLQSAPLAICLFFVFPKLAPLWAVPTAKIAKTGLSDSVKVGDIANLALSDELAFRIKFDNQVPAYSQMYWRTIVMERFDGQSWETGLGGIFNDRLGNHSGRNVVYQYDFDEDKTMGKQFDYQVITSPTYQNWLYALDLARVDTTRTQSNEIYHRQDYSLYNKKPITQNTSYYVTSYVDMPLAIDINDYSYERNLDIPESSNPRLVEKAQGLRAKYTNDEQGNAALIQEVLTTFNQDVYRYTLNPPRLDNNSLDQFYFETKAGFCEHFASSFTFLMRAAGIPSRLVTGYMGGEYNAQGSYFSVYQRDAHAWSEVWLKDKGWVRVDPTAAINPERVESGFSEQLLREQAASSNEAFSLLRYSNNNAFINAIRLQLAALDYNWTRWVVGYTAEKQNQFLAQLALAFKSLKDIEFITVVKNALLLIGALILWWVVRQINAARQPRSNTHFYQLVLLKLSKQGIDKPLAMTPKDFVLVIKKELPEIAFEFAKFSQLYSSLEYQALDYKQKITTTKAFKQSYKRIQGKL